MLFNILYKHKNITCKVIERLKNVVDLGPRPVGSPANLQAVNVIRHSFLFLLVFGKSDMEMIKILKQCSTINIIRHSCLVKSAIWMIKILKQHYRALSLSYCKGCCHWKDHRDRLDRLSSMVDNETLKAEVDFQVKIITIYDCDHDDVHEHLDNYHHLKPHLIVNHNILWLWQCSMFIWDSWSSFIDII